jgi:CYTH domain-containing protein
MVNGIQSSTDNNKLTAELEIFHDKLEGLAMVEVEFSSKEEANQFVIPNWFGAEVTNDAKYRNSNLSQQNND